ncbi:MAG: hypothetical protein NC483_05410 [Ruminococcus sp.]|nr:hypothetical protein [Ruminococcus sp.]
MKKVKIIKIGLWLMLIVFLLLIFYGMYFKEYKDNSYLLLPEECQKAYDCKCPSKEKGEAYCNCKFKKFFVTIKGFCAKGHINEDKIIEDRAKYEGDTAENIIMSIKEGTLTDGSATVIIEDLSDKDNMYGEEYTLYEKIDNEWFKLSEIVDTVVWDALDYHVNQNRLLEFEINWHYHFGKLKKGKYKLVKWLVPEGGREVYSFSVDFTI